MVSDGLPKKLYKYRTFNTNSLRMMTESEVFYADPKNFNDPLDCNPDVKVDINQCDLEGLWKQVMSEKHKPEIVSRILGEYQHNASEHGEYNDGLDGSYAYMYFLKRDIKEQIIKQFGSRGVLTLGARWDCVLMWSHYADEHKGICIEYDTDNHKCSEIGPVNYNSTRCISTKELVEWKINKSKAAERRIYDQYFFAKSFAWQYEQEWRAISAKSEATFSPFKKVSAIHFGLRCDQSIKIALVKLLSQEEIEFFSVYVEEDGFKLNRRKMDADEIDETISCGVRSSPAFYFDDLDAAAG